MIIRLSATAQKIPVLVRRAPRHFGIRQKIYDYCRVNHKEPVMQFYNDVKDCQIENRLPANVIYDNPFVRFFPSTRIWVKYATVIMTGLAFTSQWYLSAIYFTLLGPVLMGLPTTSEDQLLVRNITVDPDTLEFKITYGDHKQIKAYFEEVSVARIFRPLFVSLEVKGLDEQLLVSNFLFRQFNEEAFVELDFQNIEKFADIVNVIDQEVIDLEEWQRQVDKAMQEQEQAEK